MDTTIGELIPRGGDQFQPSVAFDGADYLVVWLDEGWSIRAARVRRDGTVLDPSGIYLTYASENSYPQAVFDGTDFFVVWSDPPCILGIRITPAGQVLCPCAYGQSASGPRYPVLNRLGRVGRVGGLD